MGTLHPLFLFNAVGPKIRPNLASDVEIFTEHTTYVEVFAGGAQLVFRKGSLKYSSESRFGCPHREGVRRFLVNTVTFQTESSMFMATNQRTPG
jgi:hypothetical protein